MTKPMTSRFLAAGFGALAMAATGPALAGSPAPVPMEPTIAAPTMSMAAPRRDWTGAYIGGALGYGDLSRGVSGDGLVAGVQGGYQQDFGNFVLGVEASYNRASIDFDGGGGSLDNVLALKMRAGVPVGDVLVYGTVGAARASATIGGVGLRETGAVGGLGAEVMVGDGWSVGGEVLHHRFTDFGGSGVDVGATTLQARVNFRF